MVPGASSSVRPSLLGAALVAMAGCVVQGSPPPLESGDGVSVANNTVSVNEGEVPVLSSCQPGQLVAKGEDGGWICVTPAGPATLVAGEGISIDGGTVAFDPGTVPGGDVWPGTIPYAQVTGVPAVTWNTIESSVSSSDSWPGTVAYSQVSGAPDVAWSTVESTVQSTDSWPGTVPYSSVTNAPRPSWAGVAGSVTSTTDWPGQISYTQVTNTPPPASWSSIKGSVQALDSWPGSVPWSSVAPSVAGGTDWPGSVAWSSVSPSVTNQTPWPGTMSYSNLTNVPAAMTNEWTVAAQSPLTGGGSVAPGGTVTVGLGTVSVANGGTGVTSFAPGALAMANSTGKSLGGFTPTGTGTMVGSLGNGWQEASALELNVARLATSPLILYVSTSGSDAVCNGTANAGASSAPNCATASLQHALDLVPEIVEQTITIQVEAGIYAPATGASALLEVTKVVKPQSGSITLTANGVVTLSGTGSSAAYGIYVGRPSQNVAIQNLAITGFASAGVVVAGAGVSLTNVSVTGGATAGMICEQAALCTLAGTNVFQQAGVGLYVRESSEADASGSLVANSNTGYGVAVDTGGVLNCNGSLTANNNTASGLLVNIHGYVSLAGAGSFAGNGGDGIDDQIGSTFSSSGGLSITVPNANTTALNVNHQSNAFLSSATATITVNCTSGTGTNGMFVSESSSLETSGAGAFNLNGCQYGIRSFFQSLFSDAGGTRNFSNVSVPTSAGYLSNFFRGTGQLPVPGTGDCAQGSQCP